MRSPRSARYRLALAAALLAASLAACAGARPGRARPAEPARRAFAIPGHGALELRVPSGWIATEQEGVPPAPRTVRLEPEGGGFVALLTPFWNPGEPEDEAARVDAAQLLAELARRNALGGAVEREVPLEELVGDGVHGFWFAATDRELVGQEPGEGEFRHVLQGAAAVGPLVLAFTLLDNAPGPQREAILEVVRGARHLARARAAGGTEGAPGGMELDRDAETVPLRVAVPRRSFTVLLDLPGFVVFKPRESEDGEEVAVLGQAVGTGVVASVIVRPARGARDAAACRDADLAKLRAGVPGLLDLRVGADETTARASYTVAELGGKPLRQLHAHAWLWRDDVCANVHVSKADPGAADAKRLEGILASARFGEDL